MITSAAQDEQNTQNTTQAGTPIAEAAPAIEKRSHLDFGFDDKIPRFWFGGSPYKTRIVDGFQLAFPEGEKYFITSVRAFRDQVTDPQQMEDIRSFIWQEGQHGMMHHAFNKLLARQGIPVEQILSVERQKLEKKSRSHSAHFNLAQTAALEHFTALMAETFFSHRDVMQDAHPKVRALMGWHAIEEMEHRAVAFDVYVQVAKGGYWMRIGAMAQATVDVFAALYTLCDQMLKADGFSLRQRLLMHIKHLPWLFGPRKGVFTKMLPKLLAYYKPDFHPNQDAVIHNYAVWVEAFNRTSDPLVAGEAFYQAGY